MGRRPNSVAAAFFLGLSFLGAPWVRAQVITGTISGYVLDPDGGTLAGASVFLSDATRGVARVTSADEAGFYRFADLAPSTYELGVSAAGFTLDHHPQVTIAVNARLRVDISLSLGGIRQRVDVTAESAKAVSESSDLAAVIDRRQIESFPVNRRDFLQLALLTPGVVPPVEGSELSARNGFAMHANGGREEANNFLLDGVDNNDPYIGRYVVQPSVDSIQEFRISTNSYSAEYGRSPAGQVNVVTRSGTNSVHAFGYEYFRNRALDARNYFDGDTKPAYDRNQFGVGGGGPLVRNRAFLFATIDFLRERQGQSRLATVPATDVRRGNLSSLGVTVVDPFTRRPFAGNTIPADRISPVGLAILDMFPAPNRAGTGGNYLYSAVMRDSESQGHVRIDQSLSSSDLLAARYSYGLVDAFEPYAEDTQALPGFGDYLRDPAHNAMLHYQRVIGPRAVNSLRLGFNRYSRNLRPENYRADVGQLWGVSWLNLPPRDFGYPSMTIAGFSKLGDATGVPIIRETSTYHLVESLGVTRGNHLLQAGAEVRHERLSGNLDMLVRGSLSFSGAISGSGLSDLLLGLPSLGLQSTANNPMNLRRTGYSVYLQDDWRATRTLTLNAGVRWEYNTPPVDPNNAMTTFDIRSGALVGVGTGGVTRSGTRPDRDNVAPRLGVAWNARHDVMVRAGYGVYYDAGILEVNTAQYFNPPQFTLRVFFPTAHSLLTLANPFPATGGYAPPASLSVVSPDFVTAFMQHWNVSGERRVAGLGALTVGYAGSRGSQLVRPRDLNQPSPGLGDVQSRRPFPRLGGIFFIESAGRSTFHSLQLSLVRPLSKGLSVRSAYTLSRSMDDGSAFLDAKGDRNFPQDSRNMAAQWGRSSFDVRHRFSTAFTYRLPGANVLTRDTDVGGIVTLQSGQPFTPILRFDNSNTGNGSQQAGFDHPDVVGDPSVATPSVDRWFNTAAFAIPARGTFGNAGRNILRGPGYASVDVSVARRFPAGRGANVWLELQVFNLLNRTNFELPELYVDEPATFGRIFAAKAPRQVQLALRVAF